MRVFLIHGMGRTPASLWPLAWRLRAQSHQPTLFGYAVTVEPLERIAERFLRRIAEVQTMGEPYAVIGHSLGNLITRFASPQLPSGFTRFIQLAPPNQSPSIARMLGENTLFKAFTQDAGRKLIDAEFFAGLPIPAVPTLIVAGDAGPRLPVGPFAESNDGILRVAETQLEGIAHLVVPAMHTFLMNRQDATRAVLSFLEHADLEQARMAALG